MIIDYLDIKCITVLPPEAQSPLLVNANTILPFAIAFQCLQLETAQEIAVRARSAWARQIEDADVVQRILQHLGLWAPRQNEPSPPALKAGVESANHADNVLTYHPVPNIA